MSHDPLNYATHETEQDPPRRGVVTWAQLLVVWTLGLAVWAFYIAVMVWAFFAVFA